MIFQIVVGSTGIITQQVPFVGPCTVKVIKIDYAYDTTAAITQSLISVFSNTLINTPLSGQILFFNITNPYYADNFVIKDVNIPGQIDIRLRAYPDNALPAGAGGYLNCIITLDITPN